MASDDEAGTPTYANDNAEEADIKADVSNLRRNHDEESQHSEQEIQQREEDDANEDTVQRDRSQEQAGSNDEGDGDDFQPMTKRPRKAVIEDDDEEETTRPKYANDDDNEEGAEDEGERNEAEGEEYGENQNEQAEGDEFGENENEQAEGEEAGEIVDGDNEEQNEQANYNDNLDDDQGRDVDADEEAQRGTSSGMSLEEIIARGAAERAKRARRSRRAKKDVEFINDADETIQRLVARMKMAAELDRRASENGTVAVAKLRLLEEVRTQLLRKELHSFMVENGMLHALTEWLAPLPDRSLPSLTVRETLLRALADFPIPNPDNLKSSGLGKAVMYMRKHPKETKDNKDRAAKLIHEWSRQIFNLQNDYRELTRDEREKRDMRNAGGARDGDDDLDGDDSQTGPVATPQRRNFSTQAVPILGNASSSKRDSAAGDGKRDPKPGEPGFIPRARVPMPSFKDYVVRPKSNAEAASQNSPKKQNNPTGIEKQLRSMRETKMRLRNKAQSAVELNIQGSKLV